MIVFKNYFKIIKRHKFSILVYSVVFLVLAIIFSLSEGDEVGDYNSVKVPVVIQNESESPIALALVDHLKSEFMEANVDMENIEDELFYERAAALIRIPSDFEEGYEVEIKTKGEGQKSFLVEQSINAFLNNVEIYQRAGFEENEAIKNTVDDLSKKADVKITDQLNSEGETYVQSYFNFLHFALISQVVLVVTTVMVSYKKEAIRNRNEVAPVTKQSQSLQLILGHVFFSVIIWLSYMIIFALLWGEGLGLISTKYMMLNSLIFTIMTVTMAMFLSKLIVKENILQAVLNIITMGTSFLAGAFVPQELLSEKTLAISKFLPSYYYIKNNNMLVENPSFSTMTEGVLIMLASSLIFILLTLIIRQRAAKEVRR